MKNVAGQPARGENFFQRPDLTEQFKQKILSGSSIVISAPRRVGKTSLMYHLNDTGMEGYFFIYQITESVNTKNEYFKRLLHKIFDAEFLTSWQKFSKKAFQTIKDRAARISEIGAGLKFDPDGKIDYYQEFIATIKSLDLNGQRIVLMIDEFSQTIENIIIDESEQSAVRFLQFNRELRQDPEINQKIQFVYSGSIGLENIVNRLNAIHLINDLDSLKVPPLSTEESHLLMQALTQEKEITLDKSLRDYVLKKIEWYIPYYIQLAVQEIGNNVPTTTKTGITKKNIDEAFARMLELRNSFEHWHTRLRKAFKGEEYTFAKSLLSLVSENETIQREEILNLAQKFNVGDHYKEILNALTYDGYLNNNIDPRVYRFNSPLLKMWWWKNVAY